MFIIFSDNCRPSIPAAIATIVWAVSLVTTFHVISQPAACVKIYWSHKIMFLSIILKYYTVIHLQRLNIFVTTIFCPKLKPYCRHAKFKHNFLFLSKNKESSKAMQVKFSRITIKIAANVLLPTAQQAERRFSEI